MRFLLDNDCDATLLGLFHANGHEAWTADQLGLAGVDAAADDAISVAAHARGAVVVTHDVAFTQRRRRNTFGKHVRIRPHQVDSVSVVTEHLDELVGALETRDSLVVELGWDGPHIYKPRWR